MGRIGPSWALKAIVFKVVCFVLRRRVVKLQIWQYMYSPRWNIREVFIKTEFHLARFITPDFFYRQKEICFKSPLPERLLWREANPSDSCCPFSFWAFSWLLTCVPTCSVSQILTRGYSHTHRYSDYWIAWNIIQLCNNGQSHSVYMDDKSLSHRFSSLSWCIVRL